MTAALTAVAKAVAARVDQIEIPYECERNRSYGDFKEELATLNTLHIDVFGEGYSESDLEDRASVKHKVQIGIAVRKRFDVADHNNDAAGKPRIKVEEIDDLCGVTQAIFDYFLHADNRRLIDDEYSIAFDDEPRLVFNPSRKMLMENHQFLGLVRLTYYASKPL